MSMKKYYSKKPYLERKSALSYYFQKFLGFDKRLRRNILIGAGLMMTLLFTGVLLALISLVQFGGNLIDEALSEDSLVRKGVERVLFHAPPKSN